MGVSADRLTNRAVTPHREPQTTDKNHKPSLGLTGGQG